ncbi:unnamed protein product [Sphagnum jensenii]
MGFDASVREQAGDHPRGRLAQTFVSTVRGDLQAAGMLSTQGDWYERAQDRPQWRANIRELPKLKVASVPIRQQPPKSCRRKGWA